MDFIRQHGVELLAIWGALVGLCSAIVKITPTQKDDAILAKIIKIADCFSIYFTKEDKKIIEEAKTKK